MKTINIQKKIYYLYLVLMPFMLFSPFTGLYNVFGEMAGSISLIFHMIGLTLIFLSAKNGEIIINQFMKYIVLMIIVLNTVSLITSLILNHSLGTLHGENTFIAVSGMLVYYLHILSIFYYNYYNLKSIDKGLLDKIFSTVIFYCLFIGYLQIFSLNNAFFAILYDSFNLFGALRESYFLIIMDRITLTGNEPASAGTVISLLILPYLLARLLGQYSIKVLILVLLFVPIIYFTKSSTVYIMFISNLLVFFVFLIIKFRFNFKNICIITCICAGIFLPIIWIANGESNIYKSEIEYLFFEKAGDTSNHSTLARTSTVINDIEVFKMYPIFGIGNGNQGYYYNENVPSNYYQSSEVQSLIRGESGIVNGGPFIPAYISGYGLLGVLLLVIFIIKSNKILYSKKKQIGYFYEMYYIASVSFFVSSIMSNDIVGNYIAVLILSFPFIQFKKNEITMEGS